MGVFKFIHQLHAITADISSSHKLTFRRRVTSLIGGDYGDRNWRRRLNGWEERQDRAVRLAQATASIALPRCQPTATLVELCAGDEPAPGACHYLEL